MIAWGALGAFFALELTRSASADRARVWVERAGGAILIAIATRIAGEPLASAR